MTKIKRLPEIQIGDTIYELDAAYRRGALHCRSGGYYRSNPYRLGSYAYDQWESGYTNEEEPGTHVIGCIDAITGDALIP